MLLEADGFVWHYALIAVDADIGLDWINNIICASSMRNVSFKTKASYVFFVENCHAPSAMCNKHLSLNTLQKKVLKVSFRTML